MCGIAGTFHYNNNAEVNFDTLHAMTSTLHHRGPDDSGYYMNPTHSVGLGHRRLSIIDVSSAGKQPISNEDGTLHIVFNGEIYNYKELREWLISAGHKFKTKTDTEVILHLFEEEGTRAFEHLNGIFAVAIFNEKTNQLTLARDKFGVKPLYYSDTAGSLMFGSEIKAILANNTYKKSLDYNSLGTFLTFRFNPSPQTLFTNIKKLPPGSVLIVNQNSKTRVQSYIRNRPSTFSNISEQDASYEYKQLLRKAIERQMMSDVPVGLLLSGGIDSAMIGKIMVEHTDSPVSSYTIGFEGSGDFNELEDARRTSQIIGTNHHDMVIGKQDYMDVFARSFYYTEEPIAMTTIPAMYLVSQRAAQDVKVVLAGQGADEPLAGYPRYIGEKLFSDYAWLLQMIPLSLLCKILPRNEQLKRALFAKQFVNEQERFLGIHTIFSPDMKEKLLHPEVQIEILDNDKQFIETIYENSKELSDSLSRLLYIDARFNLPDNLLLFNDKMSMANSIEMRVPFLDIELMSFLESLPSSLKLKRTTGKYIHKKACEDLLPHEIINRKKRGFATPMDEWLQGDFANTISRLFNEPNSAARKYFNVNYINQMVLLHQTKRENYQRHLFALLSFELWHRNFFDAVQQPEYINSEALFA
ncbi:MAG: asparagine synthase (glutamine-hydrolyzing) [Bacteriodetes bacterium]|nr:asparagine synthase (glutamine-hydrolyzing) [Bacteroidota bacterium]